MAGYTRYALLRMVPLTGEAETLDLMLAFSDLGGPVRIEESHVLDNDSRTDINRRLASRLFGWRHKMRCVFQIFDMTDQGYITTIMNRAADDEWTFYLSIDGGDSEEEVRVTAYDGPDALSRKTVIGAEYSVTFESVDLLTEIPYIDTTIVVTPGSPPVFLPAAYSLPTASATYRGRVFVYRQAGTPDQAVVCLNDGTGSYSWSAWAIG